MNVIKKLLYFLLALSPLVGAEFSHAGGPWFTGPLLAPSGASNAPEMISWQPYLYATCHFGRFDEHRNREKLSEKKWEIQPLLSITYGIADYIDIEVSPACTYAKKGGVSSLRFNDIPLTFGTQLLVDEPHGGIPDLKVRVKGIFPTGKYKNLRPDKRGTDGSGSGSYQTGVDLILQKRFCITPDRFFRFRGGVESLVYSTSVDVDGLSVYGGGNETKGKVRPGRSITLFLAGEYTLSNRWNFTFDAQYALKKGDRFTGTRGVDAQGEEFRVGNPSSQGLTIAPAIAYNHNENMGLIAGAWMSLAGKNSSQFLGGILSFEMSY